MLSTGQFSGRSALREGKANLRIIAARRLLSGEG